MTFWSKGSQGGISEGIGSNFSRNLSVVELGMVSFGLVVTVCGRAEAQKFVGFYQHCVASLVLVKRLYKIYAPPPHGGLRITFVLLHFWFCDQHRTTLIFSVARSLWFSFLFLDFILFLDWAV